MRHFAHVILYSRKLTTTPLVPFRSRKGLFAIMGKLNNCVGASFLRRVEALHFARCTIKTHTHTIDEYKLLQNGAKKGRSAHRSRPCVVPVCMRQNSSQLEGRADAAVRYKRNSRTQNLRWTSQPFRARRFFFFVCWWLVKPDPRWPIELETTGFVVCGYDLRCCHWRSCRIA